MQNQHPIVIWAALLKNGAEIEDGFTFHNFPAASATTKLIFYEFIEKKESNKMEIIRDFWGFLKERKKWWLLPMIIMLLLMGILIMSSGSAVAPFIYTLF